MVPASTPGRGEATKGGRDAPLPFLTAQSCQQDEGVLPGWFRNGFCPQSSMIGVLPPEPTWRQLDGIPATWMPTLAAIEQPAPLPNCGHGSGMEVILDKQDLDSDVLIVRQDGISGQRRRWPDHAGRKLFTRPRPTTSLASEKSWLPFPGSKDPTGRDATATILALPVVVAQANHWGWVPAGLSDAPNLRPSPFAGRSCRNCAS